MAQKKIKGLIGGNALLIALMYILVGIIMAACGRGSIHLVFWLAGVIYIILGIVQILMKSVDVKGGLITIIVGILFLVIAALGFSEECTGIILILSALPALLGTSNKLSDKFGMSLPDTGSATVNKIITIILLVVGIILVLGIVGLNDHGIVDALIRVGGVVLLVVGILDLAKALKN